MSGPLGRPGQAIGRVSDDLGRHHSPSIRSGLASGQNKRQQDRSINPALANSDGSFIGSDSTTSKRAE